MQKVPNVTEADVERIIRRDFPVEKFEAVQALLNTIHPKVPRVELAALKLANGELDRLTSCLIRLKYDWRDLLGEAEYPESSRVSSSRRYRDDITFREKVDMADWEQYHQWFNRKE